MNKINIKIDTTNYTKIPDLLQSQIDSGCHLINLNFEIAKEFDNFSNIILFLQKAIIIANDQGIDIKISNLPYCVLPDQINLISNQTSSNTKVKSNTCKKCFYDKKCTGINKYIKNFVFNPILKSSNTKVNKIEKIIKSLTEKNLIDLNHRKKLFGNVSLADILSYFTQNGYLFHASKNHYDVLKPQEAKGSWSHGNLKAIYATKNPFDAILYAILDLKKVSKFSFSTIYTEQENLNKIHNYYATKDLINNFSNGYIHIIPKSEFKFINDEYALSKPVETYMTFSSTPPDFTKKINLVPFIETRYNPEQLFMDSQREITRQFLFMFSKGNSQLHGFDHMYRVSEIAFDLALNECPTYANDVFLAACFHDLARTQDLPEPKHSIKIIPLANSLLKKFWPNSNIKLILKAIARHENIKTTNDVRLGCLMDADRIDLLRCKIPNHEYFSTDSGKDLYQTIINKYDPENIYKKWPHVFKEFLTKNKINHF